MKENYVLAIDQGTTSSRSIIFDKKGHVKEIAQKEFSQFFPKDGWVEHDAEEIWQSQLAVTKKVLEKVAQSNSSIQAIGITNQRETTVVWDRETGRPITNAIVWQDRRTADFCDGLKKKGWSEKIKDKTGLVIDSYFSGTKVHWILENIEGARKKADQGSLAFGTIDSWLIWNLTNGSVHVTDVSNASRTMLYNIHDGSWDQEILELLGIPMSMLPQVKSSSEIYGYTSKGLFEDEIPIAGIAGDQQAALFGQLCLKPGMIKNTYGTGSFIMFNTGDKPIRSENNLLTTIGWKRNGQISYALEGSVFMAGAIVQWLRDGLGIIKKSSEIEALALTVPDNGGVYFVPAFTGLGAPHWDPNARGSIMGLSRGSTAGHIARAALEGIAFQVYDVVQAMQEDSGIEIKELRVDGGVTVNNKLMQFQADILGIPIIRPKVLETTALGAAYLAGLAVGYWSSINEIQSLWEEDVRFEPKMSREKADDLLLRWNKAVQLSKAWSDN